MGRRVRRGGRRRERIRRWEEGVGGGGGRRRRVSWRGIKCQSERAYGFGYINLGSH